MMRLPVAFSFILSLSLGSTAGAVNLCAHIFERFVVTTEIQKHITSTVSALAELRLNLDLAQATGQTAVEFTVLKNDYTVKENQFVGYLEGRAIMTRSELKDKIKLAISDIQHQIKNQNRDKPSEESIRRKQLVEIKNKAFDGSHILLHEIQPGSFKMGGLPVNKVEVQITRPFELMATLTTQLVWRKVVELAEKRFGTYYRQVADPSSVKADNNPVENITFSAIQEWIGSLNKLSQAGDPALFELIQNFKQGDRFRLPTEAEWEFVLRGRGENNEAYPVGKNSEDLLDYAWTKENSLGHVHPVSQKKPLFVDDKPFYDMPGNVFEFVADSWMDYPPGGTDPNVSESSTKRVVRGGAWDMPADYANSGGRSHVDHNYKNGNLGFRLVREVQK